VKGGMFEVKNALLALQ